MKIRIEIVDAILVEATKLAARQGTTPRTLVERGLKHLLEKGQGRECFRLRDARVRGGGWLRPEVREGGWEKLADLTYGAGDG